LKSTIDPSHYDVGGVVTSVGGSANEATNQRILPERGCTVQRRIQTIMTGKATRG
jgi:hypothetical protein